MSGSHSSNLPPGATVIPMNQTPSRLRETFSRASPSLVTLRADGLLPATTQRAQDRIAQLKRVFLSPLADVKKTQSSVMENVVTRLRLTKSVRNVKVAAGASSATVVGSLCMPFTTCCAVPSSALQGGGGGASSGAMSSLVMTGSVDGLLTLWDTQTCQPQHSESSCAGNVWGRVRSIASHPTAPVCFSTTMFSREISAWQIRAGASEEAVEGVNSSFHFSSLSNAEDNNNNNSNAGEPNPSLHIARINQLAVDPTGHLLASTSDDATLRLWDVHRLEPTTSSWSMAGAHLLTHDGYESVGPVLGVAFHPDGSLVSTSDAGGRVVSWDTRTGRHAFSTGGTTGGHLRLASCVAWSPCGVRCASGGADGVIHLWDARMLYKEQQTAGAPSSSRPAAAAAPFMLLGHEDTVTSLSFYANPLGDGGPLGSTIPVALVSTSLDHTVRLWDMDTGLCVRSLNSGAPVYQHCRPAVDGGDAAAQTSIFTVGHSKYWSLWNVVDDEEAFELLVKETELMASTKAKMAHVSGAGGDDEDGSSSSSDDEMAALKKQAAPGASAVNEEDDSDDDEDEMALLRR